MTLTYFYNTQKTTYDITAHILEEFSNDGLSAFEGLLEDDRPGRVYHSSEGMQVLLNRQSRNLIFTNTWAFRGLGNYTKLNPEGRVFHLWPIFCVSVQIIKLDLGFFGTHSSDMVGKVRMSCEKVVSEQIKSAKLI